MTCSLQY